MGGTNEDTIGGLRFHANNGEIHVHDDSRNLKFSALKDDFKEKLKNAFDILEDEDGIIKIDGISKEKLCICKENNITFAFIINDTDIKQKLNEFLKSC